MPIKEYMPAEGYNDPVTPRQQAASDKQPEENNGPPTIHDASQFKPEETPPAPEKDRNQAADYVSKTSKEPTFENKTATNPDDFEELTPEDFPAKIKAAAKNLITQPKIVGLIAAVAFLFVFAATRKNPQKDESPAARLSTINSSADGFPIPDFKHADRGAYTMREGAALFRQYEQKNQPASDDANGNRLYTADEVKAAIQMACAAKSRKVTNRHGRRASRALQKPAEPPPPRPNTGKYFAVGGLLDMHPTAKRSGKHRLALNLGTRIPAKLDVGISSAKHGTALASTLAQITTLDGMVIPRGSIVSGRSSHGKNRIFIQFKRIEIAGVTYELTGAATKNTKLGVSAEVHESGLEDRAESSLASDALGTVKSVVAGAGGAVGRGIANLSDGAVKEAQREVRVDRSVLLEVPAGTKFEIVITGK